MEPSPEVAARTAVRPATVPRPPSTAELAAIVDHGPMATLLTDPDGTIEWVSQNLVDLVGTPVEELVGSEVFSLLPDVDVARARAAIEAMKSFHLRTRGMVYRVRTSSGEYEPCLIAAQPHEVDGRSFVQVSIMSMPMRLVVGEALQSVLRGASLFDSLAEIERVVTKTILGARFAISFLDPETGQRRLVGSIPPELAGLAPTGLADDLAALPWARAIRTGETQVVDELSALPDDVAATAAEHGQAALIVVPVPHPASDEPTLVIAWVPVREASVAMLRGIEDAIVPVLALVLDRQHHLRRVQWAAEHDQLTRLDNGTSFHGHLRDLRDAGFDRVAVLYLDVDDFKAINDRYGHATGDAVLRSVAARISATVPTSGRCARLGGDEFAVALPGASDAEATAVAVDIVEAMTAPIEAVGDDDHEPGSIPVSVSIGVASGTTADDPAHVVSRADAALLDAKRTEKGSWRVRR